MHHSADRSLWPYRVSVIGVRWWSSGCRGGKQSLVTAQSGCLVGSKYCTENASDMSSAAPKGNAVVAQTPGCNVGIKARYWSDMLLRTVSRPTPVLGDVTRSGPFTLVTNIRKRKKVLGKEGARQHAESRQLHNTIVTVNSIEELHHVS